MQRPEPFDFGRPQLDHRVDDAGAAHRLDRGDPRACCLTDPFTINRWLLAGGIASFVLVMSVLVLFSVSLVGEILESRRQQMFIDSVTHELKSPLASIKLCLETMARPGVSVAQQDQLRGMMQSDVERLTVFDDILQASFASPALRRPGPPWMSHGSSRRRWRKASAPATTCPEAFGLTYSTRRRDLLGPHGARDRP
jgi:hypothetical protein